MFWTLFHSQVEAMAEHNWMAQEKSTQLLAILQGQAVDLSEVRYKDITEVLKGRYRVHQLFMVYCSQVSARVCWYDQEVGQLGPCWATPVLHLE
jgi:hypothetical protein